MSSWLLDRVQGPPNELAPSLCQRMILDYMSAHAADTYPPWSQAVRHQLIIEMSSAELERDFKCMRQLMDAASWNLQEHELSKRLRLSLNCPPVLERTPESKVFIADVVQRMQARETGAKFITSKPGKKRGRPKGSLGAKKRNKILGTFDTHAVQLGGKIRDSLTDISAADDEALVRTLSSLIESTAPPRDSLLSAAKIAAASRSEAVSAAQQAWHDTEVQKHIRKSSEMPELPRVASKMATFTSKDLNRYFQMLLAPAGKSSSDVKLNTKEFVDSWVRFILATKTMQEVSSSLFALEALDTLDGRVGYVLAARAEMRADTSASSSGGAASSSATDVAQGVITHDTSLQRLLELALSSGQGRD